MRGCFEGKNLFYIHRPPPHCSNVTQSKLGTAARSSPSLLPKLGRSPTSLSAICEWCSNRGSGEGAAEEASGGAGERGNGSGSAGFEPQRHQCTR